MSAGPPFPGPSLWVATSRPGPDVCVVEVAGELDMATAPTLREHLRRETASRPAVLVVDLSGVTFLGAAGVTVVLGALRGDGGVHGRLHVVAPAGGPARRALHLTGVHAVLRVHPDVADALAAARA